MAVCDRIQVKALYNGKPYKTGVCIKKDGVFYGAVLGSLGIDVARQQHGYNNVFTEYGEGSLAHGFAMDAVKKDGGGYVIIQKPFNLNTRLLVDACDAKQAVSNG